MSLPDPIFLATAVEAALEAGRIHRRYFRKQPVIRKKGPIDLVTAADLETEEMFRGLVAARFPDHAVIGEETPSAVDPAGASHRWIIDPVDGTTNFAHGLAMFCVSIGLEIDGRVDVGVVFDPIADELFTAERGAGARLNGARIAVSSTSGLTDAVVSTGRREVPTFAAFVTKAMAVRRFGAAALDLSYVACGRLDGYWEAGLYAWDIAAGALILEEAGGTITALDGSPLDLSRGDLIASNGTVHAEMAAVIAMVARQKNGTIAPAG